MKRITLDIEATGLLDETTVDYTASPWELKDNFQIHCITVKEWDTGKIVCFYNGWTIPLDGREHVETVEDQGEVFEYTLKDYEPVEYEHKLLCEFHSYIDQFDGLEIIAHNGINYDLLVLMVKMGIDYTIGPDTFNGKPAKIYDTLVMSKTFNPDRFGGHSLEAWGERHGVEKVDFRPHLSPNKRFLHFGADMLYYNIFDVENNEQTFKHLVAEAGTWNWKDAFELEKAVAEIITRQQHRGFWFDKELALKNIQELDNMMIERKAKVDPILPPKEATKKFLADHTPPKKQLKMNLSPTAHMNNWVERLGGKFLGEGQVELLGKVYDMPLPEGVPIVTQDVATIDDTTHIKGWLVSLGWVPSEFQERDLSTNAKKIKLSPEKYKETVERYIEQTLNGPFKELRCEIIGVTEGELEYNLLNRKTGRAVKVPTNPKFTRGQDKEVCPNLMAMGDKFPFAKDIIEYLTYKHRRNSILGGNVGWDEDEEEFEKGFLANTREDGRIPTPADTCGAATSRFRHRLVVNVPRATSLYGEPMRAMFGTDEHFLLLGYDFSSLEARMEGHYVYKYDIDKQYTESLLAQKPNDLHTRASKHISSILNKEFSRDYAKNLNYGVRYGAQIKKVSKMLGCDMATAETVLAAFWEAAKPLKLLSDALIRYWETTGEKKFILGIDGRKVPTRSKHALINSLFQSAGVICAKRAMVIHDRKLRENGLIVNFWKDDWRNKQFCQQLIAMHDEAQSEVSKKLVEFKIFNTEEEAENFSSDSDRIWSGIGHGKNGKFYKAWCLPAQLAIEAVNETSEYYKLNIPLGAEYMIHNRWSGTH